MFYIRLLNTCTYECTMYIHIQANRLIEYVEKQGSQYRSNSVILTMGEDFQYTSAAINFRSMDKLIKLVHTTWCTMAFI